eukprot:TRINITY_DN66829_c0_g1_i1.p1 TRINITY_DN66829_c0_g1~~TRINITY_DN66829_c0_g1_i1.p1  ORF type:complete len:249 (-),score=46.26 TRINITY_DN66829_c0_g1_i1:224-970(-)
MAVGVHAADEKIPMELDVDLGPMPNESTRGSLLLGLRSLLDKRELCDVALVVGSEVYPAHRAVLAASSQAFRDKLENDCCSNSDSNGPVCPEAGSLPFLRLESVKHPEAVQALLDSVYGTDVKESDKKPASYSPSSEGANRDVLRLARDFGLPTLEEQAARGFAEGLTTANVMERLAACEEFGLRDVKEKILDQLISNHEVLYELANDPAVLQTPSVLQELLLRVLGMLGCGRSAPGSVATQDQPRKA